MEREKRKRKTDGRVWEEKRGLRAGGEREKERETEEQNKARIRMDLPGVDNTNSTRHGEGRSREMKREKVRKRVFW